MISRRALFYALTLLLAGILVACVPESDIERASGGNSGDDDTSTLTPISENELPDLPEISLRVLSVNVERGANRVVAEISLGGGSEHRIELADVAEVEWSDGERSEALPFPGDELIVESQRSDPTGDVFPVRLILNNISWRAGTDPNAEITLDEITTEWGTFPVLSIENASRPPGYHLNYQAAGQRWISRAEVRKDGRPLVLEGSSGSFDDEFRPLTGSLRFGPEFDELESELPLPAHVDVRVAVPAIDIDLQ